MNQRDNAVRTKYSSLPLRARWRSAGSAGKLHRQRRQEARLNPRRAPRSGVRPLSTRCCAFMRGDAILTDNWHTNEVLSHARNNFEGVHLRDAHAGGVGRDDRE